jgi:hypothetical protein
MQRRLPARGYPLFSMLVVCSSSTFSTKRICIRLLANTALPAKPTSNDFLPLAIKPNANGSSLVYTPQDLPNDWLLAKMMFNLNSFWHAQWYHLGATHVVGEIVYLSAIRTLSEEHPIMAVLHRREPQHLVQSYA